MKTVDLNADMGEGVGDDAALLGIVTSANVACGFHAGGPAEMAQTMALAAANGVRIGAHPGFDDKAGFGRHRMDVPHDVLAAQIRYQVGAALGVARGAGARLHHLKLHGALANMASEDAELARVCYDAALSVAPDMAVMVLAATAQQHAAEALGITWLGEIFADRAYNDDATLVDRSMPGAVIHDAELAGARMADMLRAGAIITASGAHIDTRIDTICLHGDTREAVEIARAVRAALMADGMRVG